MFSSVWMLVVMVIELVVSILILRLFFCLVRLIVCVRVFGSWLIMCMWFLLKILIVILLRLFGFMVCGEDVWVL